MTVDVVTSSSTISIVSTTLPPINNEVIKSLGKLGNSCTDDYFCRRAVPQSHCYNGECACIDGFIPLDLYTCIRSKLTIEKSDIFMNFSLARY